MSYASAVGKLLRDLLFDFANKAGHVCFRCGGKLARDDFSVDHETAWRLADDPKAAFFDLTNIAFSRKACNSIHNNRPRAAEHGYDGYKKGCRCAVCKQGRRRTRKPYSAEERRARYLEFGT